MSYKVSVYPESFEGKDKSYIAKQSKKITALIPRNMMLLGVEGLAAMIENKHVFCPATFCGGHKSQDELAAIQFFALDFDDGLDIDTAVKRAEEYKLPIAIMYETSSSVNWSKFRLIFLCEQEVNDKDLAVLIQYCLCTVFPEVDKTSKDFSKLYYPGKNIKSQDKKFSIYDLLISTLLFLDRNDPANKVRTLRNISKKSNVVLRNNTFAMEPCTVPEEVESFSPYSLLSPNKPSLDKAECRFEGCDDFKTVTIHSDTEIAQESSVSCILFYKKGVPQDKTSRQPREKPVRTNIGGDTLCQLLNDFKSGKRLVHDEWFGLCTNLIHIKGGKALICRIFDEHSDIYADPDRKLEQIDFAVRNEYKAWNCEDYCPYAADCDHSSNMVYTLKESSRMIRKTGETIIFKPIEEMRYELKAAIEKANNTSGVKIIKAPTGAGKTYGYLEAAICSEKQTIVAVPNKMLMDNVASEAEKMGISYITTPIIEDVLNKLDRNTAANIRQMYTIGNERSVNYLLRECGETTALDYLNAMDKVRSFKGQLVITTHARFMNMKPDYLRSRNVIIDEDIFPAMIQIKEISVPDIQKMLRNYGRNNPLPSDVHQKLDILTNIQGYTTLESVSRDYYDSENRAIMDRIHYGVKSAVFPALKARHFFRARDKEVVQFINFLPLPYCDCTILSATINEKISSHILGSRLKSFSDLGMLENIGKLYLHHDCSYSRSCIEENEGLMDELRKKYDGKSNIITFKDHARYGELYFGAAQGSNRFAGKDLAVIGTFHRPEYVYKLWAMLMGNDDAVSDVLAVRKVERNGFVFPFMTYSDPLLREIQLYMIESESEQAVGRARIVSNNCRVDLHSNLPLRQSIILN